MQGIEKAEKFFLEHGRTMLENEFPELLPRIAAGISGRGSECFGFDDIFSRDHDFFPGFTMWLSDEDEAEYGFKLSRAYTSLVREHFPEEIKRSILGCSERGVMRISDFFRRHLGFPGVPENFHQWLNTPEYAFAEVINGRIFMDEAGVFTAIRRQISSGMPEDVRRKKIAARAVIMAQSGQYNFPRCLKHGEKAAAEIALMQFAENCVSAVFLLNRTFAPYYKWMFRAMKNLPLLPEISGELEVLLTEKNDDSRRIEAIEDICGCIVSEFNRQGLSCLQGCYLEPHAFEIVRGIADRELRAMHIMEG